MCTITVGTLNLGMQSLCSVGAASRHRQESAWHCLNDGKKAPYGKCEKSQLGASSSRAEGALALPGTRSGAYCGEPHGEASNALQASRLSVRKRNA
eukprot:387495-Pleurochrysis_carterae.AAC.1